MIRRIAKRVLGLGTTHGSGAAYDQTAGKPPAMLREYVAQAAAAQASVRDLVSGVRSPTVCISLGENCSTAWYLKQVGLKQASFPFDWIFCSTEIVTACVEDRFETYLDRRQIQPRPDGSAAGHAVYHANMFNHRNPLKSPEDYAYHERCCSRFLDALDSDAELLFICTLVNEPAKRPDWSRGFRHDFALPENQTLETCRPMIEKLTQLHARSRFLVIELLTERTPRLSWRRVDDRVLSIAHESCGTSTGVYFPDLLDDFTAKLVFSGLSVG